MSSDPPTDGQLRRALDLLGELDRAGFTVTLRGEAVIVVPGSRLNIDQMARLRGRKPALLWLLARLPSPEAQAALDAAPPPCFGDHIAPAKGDA